MARADDEHLTLLAILHYVFAGLMSFGIVGQLLYLGFLVAIVTGALTTPGGPPPGAPGGPLPPPPPPLGWILIGIFSLCLLLSLAFVGCILFAGRCLSQRRAHLFCVLMAALASTSVPFGTILGVFTLVVLFRPSVKEQFALGGPPPSEEEEEDWGPREAPAEREHSRRSGSGEDGYYSR